ncbi:3-dehydroquinate synthetase [Thermanaerovibrio velox DSM 12556]|uniref:Shikimate kinase n=1 Tax=Thermanaerovibrio velox DSM 12556 TaxID=926567 RepID=H0UNF5_9BACT|nr:bifunctional shikimate kinase/3-dehydroquinate synthase [Thermanaerovibrio velox]EHM09362.1 3-dehydroquinate synthetase [Thermanaerovibrio velox DSM 12556]
MRGLNDMCPVFLTGFMGSGKTTVGRELARLMGVPFLDLDRMVEMGSRLTVEEIFRRGGEESFRALEREALLQTLGLGRCVVALGGGTLMDPRNLEAVRSSGRLVALKVPLDVASRRIGGDVRPPMESSSLEELFEARRRGYEAAEIEVGTHRTGAREAARLIASALKLEIRSPGAPREVRSEVLGLTVRITDGEFVPWGISRVVPAGSAGEIFAVGDCLTGPLFVDPAVKGVHLLPRGEAAKDLKRVEELYDAFWEAGVRRSSTVAAVGGGTVGDAAAFAASTYLRGVGIVHFPTTLLAQVDSSVGGKCGVNMPQGKNLVGSFVFPSLTVCDVGCLMSLSEHGYRQGLGEVAKYAMMDREFFRWLEAHGASLLARDRDVLMECVFRCLRLKLSVVEKDPFETRGGREALNLGHTVGHALEALRGFKMGHGDAVASSLMVDLALSVRLGVGEPAMMDRLGGLLSALRLPVSPGVPWGDLEGFVMGDKKWRNGSLMMPLPGPNGVVVRPVGLEDLRRAYSEVVGGA